MAHSASPKQWVQTSETRFQLKLFPTNVSHPINPAYDEYIAALTKAGKSATHDYRRNIFFAFRGKAFEIKPGDVEIEAKLRVPEVRGFIDALYNVLIFEFKKNLKCEHDDAMRVLAYHGPISDETMKEVDAALQIAVKLEKI